MQILALLIDIQIFRLLTFSLRLLEATLSISIFKLLVLVSLFPFKFILANFKIDLQRYLFNISLIKLLLVSFTIYFLTLLAGYIVTFYSAARRLTLALNAVFISFFSFFATLLLSIGSSLSPFAPSVVSRLLLAESLTLIPLN